MIQKTSERVQNIYSKFQVNKPWDTIIIFVLNVLLTIPVFIIAHQSLKDPNWVFQLDRILLFVLILITFQLLLRAMRKIILIALFIYIVILFIGTAFGGYGFVRVIEDYRHMLYSMAYNPNPQKFIISKLLPFPNKTKTIQAIEFENPRVRDFAIGATTKYFRNIKGYPKYRIIIQCFAVFKKINSNWNYVSDPKDRDYISKASASLKYLSGDCDDHSILMAAAVKAIGGTPRLVHTDAHIYPEILIGNKADLETVNYLIKKMLFKSESASKSIHYHTDEYGQIWINLDYTAKYPGGPFLSEEILGVLTLD
jgi:heme/copper-type cytochrome/quinol oxidase subunit 4